MSRISKKKRQIVHVKISKSKERKAKYLAKNLFRCLRFLSASMRKCLISRGLLSGKSSAKKDSQACLKIIEQKWNLTKFLFRNGQSNKMVNTTIRNAIDGRNCVCHNNLPQIYSEWDKFLDSWIGIGKLVNDPKVATKLKRIQRILRRHIARSTLKVPRSDVSALAIFRKLQYQQQKNKRTRNNKKVAVYMGGKTYDIIIDTYSPALDEYLTVRKHQSPTSVIDCWSQTNLVFEKCTPCDFQSPSDGIPFNMAHLQTAVDGRHDAVHEKHSRTLLNWGSSLSSMVYVCKGIGANKAANKISKVIAQLNAAKHRASQDKKFHRIRLFSNVVIKGKHLRTSNRCLKKRLGVKPRSKIL